jgi:hypothetical protein
VVLKSQPERAVCQFWSGTGYSNREDKLNTFCTSRLPLAAYIHCGNLLEPSEVRRASTTTAIFEFFDPENFGEGLEMDSEHGRAIVDSRAFASSERFLKRKMYRTLRQEEN